MTTSNENKLKMHIAKVLGSCKGTSWELKTISDLRAELKNKLGLREILIDSLLAQ